MRTIKVKAKTSDGEWVEGCYYVSSERHFIKHPKSNMGVEIDHSTLCQFTGLTDKNGREIYEGDIFRYSGLLYVVEWIRYGFRFKLMDEPNQHKHWYLDDINIQNECEVIGNIHDK